VNRPTDFELNTRQGRLAGLGWRRSDAPRVLCLHGWLDNAASFVPLAPHLPELDLVALDLPGHGLSEHRHTTTRYHFIDYLFDIDAALDELGWDDCHLLGHSMGAAISASYSAGAPERVRSLVLLDSMGPISVTADGTTARLRRSLFKHRLKSRIRQFDSIEEMIRARQTVAGLSESAARLICSRGARRRDDHFEWRSDPALNWISALVMTDEQALDLIGSIRAPALTFTATLDAPWSSKEKLAARQAALKHARHETLEGHHHFHMDMPERIAGKIQTFIAAHDEPPGENSS
jgi:pimeloyl-ACP methyl ester carboxylesterase